MVIQSVVTESGKFAYDRFHFSQATESNGFLSEPWPAWTAIGITELAVPGAHVEIRVTAQKSWGYEL